MKYLRRKSDGYIYPYSELLLNFKPDMFEIIDKLPSTSESRPEISQKLQFEDTSPDQAVLLGDSKRQKKK